MHTGLSNLAQNSQRRSGGVHHGALSDLQDQQVRGHAVHLQQSRHSRREVGVLQLPGRDVDGDLDRCSLLKPAGAQRQRQVQHPHAQRHDQAALLSHPDEGRRWQDRAVQVAQTDQ